MKTVMRSFVTILLFVGIFGLPQGESSAADDHDDSDMWMEPDELPPPQYSVVKSESRVVRQYSTTPRLHHHQQQHQSQQPHGFRPSYSTISRVEHYEPEVVVSPTSYDAQNPAPAEQNFFPSFFRTQPLSGLFRPQKPTPQPSQAASIVGRYSVGRAVNFDQSILGSGDFSVVRGGTFYPEGERSFRVKGDDDFVATFLNGHGRPSAQASTASRKEPYYPENPFENFKDFADINAGADPAFSHFVVVYANKNSTKPHPKPASPKNIFEQLQLLDLEKEKEKQDEISEDKKLMKLSKFKSKLAKTKKVVKKYKKKLGPKIDSQSSSSAASPDYTDPLLALS